MQIVLAEPGLAETQATFTLTVPVPPAVNPNVPCPLCSDRPPVWLADPASRTAMDPDNASPIKSSECCAVCLNALLDDGVVTVLEINPDAF